MGTHEEIRGEELTLAEFNGQVVPVVLKLWFGKAFGEYWNDENRAITFRSFARYPVTEVIEAFREHRFHRPDGRQPVWGEITASMRAARPQDSQATVRSFELPGSYELNQWANGKSDGDMTHLWFLVAEQYRGVIDTGRKWWDWLDSSPPRCEGRLVLCWAAEKNLALQFRQGSDEWQKIVDEYDRQQRKQ